jgi:glycosyltransferase involved in cell wall biosynthesis
MGTTSPLRILMVNLGFPPESVGGSELYTYHLSKALIEKGHEVTVLAAVQDVTLNPFEVIHTSFENISIIKIANSPVHARSFADHFLSAQVDASFIKIIGETKPDLVHFQHLAYLSGRLPEAAHRLNVPSILTLHDYWYLCFRSRLLRPGYGICPGPSGGTFCASCNHKSAPDPMAVPRFPLLVKWMSSPRINPYILSILEKFPALSVARSRGLFFKRSRNDRAENLASESSNLAGSMFRYALFKEQLRFPEFLLSPSIHLKKRYENEGFKQLMVLPLGFHQTRRLEKLAYTGKLKIGYLGNIERHKGVGLMLTELGKVLNLDKIEIDIHGGPKDPLYFAEIKKMTRQRFGEKVRFHGGYQSAQDLDRILAKTHLVVFPSVWEENYPLVIREALLRGVPVVGSNLGGVSEIIEDGVNGFLFNPYQEGDLLAKINLVLDNPHMLDVLVGGARNTTIENMDEHVSKLCDLYTRALENKRNSDVPN